jgi:flagellar biosynthesis GTPase FlhF
MTRRHFIIASLLFFSLAALAGCQTYTQRKALERIEVYQDDQEEQGPETRYSVILAAKEAEEAAARQQEEAEEQENAWEDAQRQIASLTAKNEQLEATLAQLRQTVAEQELQARLEAEAAEREAQAKAEQEAKAAAAEAERVQKMEEEARQLQLAREQQARQIPPLDQITFPREYSVGNQPMLSVAGDPLDVLMLPLDDIPWTDEEMADEIARSIGDLHPAILFVTGAMENVIEITKRVGMDGVLFEDGAILSVYAVTDMDDYGMEIRYSEDRQVRLSIADLPQYSVVQAFRNDGDWKTIQQAESQDRIDQVKAIIAKGDLATPTIVGASLYEPSFRDWDIFSPIAYRQMEYAWPLADTFEQEAFYDTYRTTHFDAATDAGNTIDAGDLKERIDYLFARKVLPLHVTVMTAGPLSVPGDDKIARYALYGSYLIP